MEGASLETRHGLCGICPAGCFVTATLDQGRLVAVEPRQGHPLGMICRIGRHSPQIVHDPDRLLYPLVRSGPKGSYNFRRIGWDQAFDMICERFQGIKAAHGAEAVAIYTGRGSFDQALCDVFQPAGVAVSSASSVLFPFGSPNTLGVGALCYVSFAMIAPHVTMGEMLITMETDLDQSELIVVWGANPATDSPPLAHRQILDARGRGARVISIDPARRETAREAEAEWIPLRPGTDGAVALAMIQVLIAEELYDERFVNSWTVGFDDLQRYVQHFTPEVVEEISGIPADTIREVARAIAAARGACPVMYSGLEYSDSGVQAIRAVLILWGLAGQLDVPGGLLFRMKDTIFPQNRSHLLPNPDPGKALGHDRFPVYSAYRGESHAMALPEAVLEGRPYRVRALTVLGGSIITAWPQPDVWRRMFSALDFMVCINRYHTADSAYADLVLPAATGYEITSYMRYGPLFKIREPLVAPQGEARSDFLILAELARRLGYGGCFPQGEEELLRHALEGSGFSLEGVQQNGGEARLESSMMQYRKWEKGLLRPDGTPGFATPSGKFEISSSILAEHGYDPLPVYTEPGEGPLADPELARRYPLVFNSGARTPHDFRSQHHGVATLAEGHIRPTVTVNRQDAAALGISEGERVWVETPRGRAPFVARLSDDIIAGCIDAAMGGGGPLGSTAWQECNVNELTDLERFDPISGFPVYKTLLCRLVRQESDQDREGRTAEGECNVAELVAPDGAHHTEVNQSPVRRVYLDHNATTPMAPEVAETVAQWLTAWGNPSSIHRWGRQARTEVENARRIVAQALNCTARRVIFTGGGSEADNLAISGVAAAADGSRRHLITSSIEHPAVLEPCRALASRGFELTLLPVNRQGIVEPEDLGRALRPDTLLVSVMLANNETGAIQPIRELARLARGRGALFHCDAVQGAGKLSLDVEELEVDLLTISAHKLHGPQGVGALYVLRDVRLEPLVRGGGQEWGMRAGTENVAGIAGFGKAVELAGIRLNNGQESRLATLRNRLEKGIAELVPGAIRNGPPLQRLSNTLSVTLPELRGESLVLMLDRRGIAFSSGSACKSGNPEPSRALLAMGLTPAQAHCTVRFSLGYGNDEQDIDYLLECLRVVLGETRAAVRFSPCR